MVWDTNAPAMIAQLRTQIAACAVWVTESGGSSQATAQQHFPSANPSGANGSTADPLPLCELASLSTGFRRFAEGAGPLEQGTLIANFIFPATAAGGTAHTAGQIETFAKTLINQLMAQGAGIPFKEDGVGHEMASDPSPGSIAADAASHPTAFRTLKITLPYGLHP